MIHLTSKTVIATPLFFAVMRKIDISELDIALRASIFDTYQTHTICSFSE